MNNLNKFFDGLSPIHESIGVNIENPENDKLIHEAIIFDELGGSMSALNEFYSNIGAFGARDGVLNESASFDLKLHSLDRQGFAKSCAILTVAHESGCQDYELYRKAMLLMEAAMDNMSKKYSKKADERLDGATKKVVKNARIQDALDKTKKAQKAKPWTSQNK